MLLKKVAANKASGQPKREAILPVHLHVENMRSLGEVFEASPARVEDALSRYPSLKGKVRVTVGYDGDIFDKEIPTTSVLFAWDFDRTRLAERAPHLRWVHVHGAGVNHLLPMDWLPKNAVLTNSRGVHGSKADEYTIMALLMLNNNLPVIVTNQRNATWNPIFNTTISGKTVLIVGVGHLGGGAAKWAKAFGLHVIGVRRSGKPHKHVDEMHMPAALHDLLPRADFVLLSLPHTDETNQLIGEEELALIKPGAGLVNFSRAGLVDYEALQRKLVRNEISAILDVFDPEPLPSTSSLWATPNLIMTPHCSADDRELYTLRTLELVFSNMERFVEGKRLLNIVDRHRQY
jgi:phosphoglycerate dehydrogenase-like enzyme